MKRLGGVASHIIFGRAVLFDDRFWHQGIRWSGWTSAAPNIWEYVIDPLVVDLVETGGAVNRLEEKYLRPIEGQQVVIIKEHHRFQRLAALELSKDAFEQRTQRFGEIGSSIAHLRVAWHVVNRVDGPQVPFDPVFVESQQRWRFERKQGKCRHERIR